MYQTPNQMKNFTKAVSLLLLVVLVQCKNAKQNQEDDYTRMAEQKLGADVEYSPNGDSSMILCFKKRKDESNSGYGVSFFVFDTEEKKVVYEEEIGRGTVTWHSDKELALFYTPGIMRKDQTRDDFTYIYHLVSKEKVVKSEL